jgi:hypothetical protein
MLSVMLLVSLVSLSTGSLELGGRGCHCDDERGALLHEEHAHGVEDRLLAVHVDAAHLHDVCPPFCADCHGCSSCFHPLAIEVSSIGLPVVRFTLDRPRHSMELPTRPPRWEPSPPLHVPRASRV